MKKYFNEKLFNKGLQEFSKEHESKIMVRVDDINDNTATLTFGFGDGSEFYMMFGSLILAKYWKVTIESPKLIYNLADFIHFSVS